MGSVVANLSLVGATMQSDPLGNAVIRNELLEFEVIANGGHCHTFKNGLYGFLLLGAFPLFDWVRRLLTRHNGRRLLGERFDRCHLNFVT
jgi:hypothetical protein